MCEYSHIHTASRYVPTNQCTCTLHIIPHVYKWTVHPQLQVSMHELQHMLEQNFPDTNHVAVCGDEMLYQHSMWYIFPLPHNLRYRYIQ